MIESILFYKVEPVKKTVLAEFLGVTLEEVNTALNTLETSLCSRGIRLSRTDTHAQLVTAKETSALIESMRKAELTNDIGKAGAETLAIILYRGPISRAEIDHIRGVNSTFIIRNLLIRGLIERRNHPTDTRSYTYAVTPQLLNHLGIGKKEELPEFSHIMDSLDAFQREVAPDAEQATP